MRGSSACVFAAAVALALAGLSTALPYDSSSPVQSFTESNFEAKIKAAGFCLVEVG